VLHRRRLLQACAGHPLRQPPLTQQRVVEEKSDDKVGGRGMCSPLAPVPRANDVVDAHAVRDLLRQRHRGGAVIGTIMGRRDVSKRGGAGMSGGGQRWCGLCVPVHRRLRRSAFLPPTSRQVVVRAPLRAVRLGGDWRRPPRRHAGAHESATWRRVERGSSRRGKPP
jgi:hypothetical protein